MDSIHKLTKDFASRYGLGKTFPAIKTIDVANRVAQGRYRATMYKNGRLTIEVPIGPSVYFLKKQEKQILEEINSAIGRGERVEKLSIRGV